MRDGDEHVRTPYLFISYASSDRERVLAIVAALREAGIACWIDQHGIEGGANWGLRITEAIEGCLAFALMSSLESLTSRNVRQEIALAWRYDRPYLPLLLDATPVPKEIAYWLETAQWIEIFDHPVESWLPKVRQALERLDRRPDAAIGLPETEPAVFASIASSLPSPPSSFVGRDREVMEVAGLLQHDRIVTLTGPGGIGKTRIAIAVGHRIRDAYPGDVAFVDLAPFRDPALVLPAIAATLGVRESGGRSTRDALIEALRGPRRLLILDNVEQVIDAASQLSGLVAQCPDLTILVTSREPLRIAGETEYAIAPLPLPAQTRTADLAELRENPTVALFVQRSRAARAGFDLTAGNAETIAAICRRLDGLPLAIELAAARSRVLTPQSLQERLSDPLRFLTGGARDLPDRQRTIRDTIAWSYDLLAPDEQRLLRHLSAFVGGWTLEGAEADASAGGDIDVLDGLTSLVEKSLVIQREQAGGADADNPRFDMLGTIREFGHEQLVAGQETDDVRRRHALWFATLAEQFWVVGYWGSEQAAWLQRLENERDNLRAAFETLLEQGEVATATELFANLRNFWWDRGPYSEPQRWFDVLLPRMSSAPAATQARALSAAGILAAARHDLVLARSYQDESLALFEALDDQNGIATAVYGLSRIDLAIGDLDAARETTGRALALLRAVGDRSGTGGAACDLALVLIDDGDLDGAAVLLDEALTIARDDRNAILQVGALVALGLVSWERSDIGTAAERWREAMRVNAESRELQSYAESFEGLAMVAAGAGQPERAARLVGAADAIREALPEPRSDRAAARLDRGLAPAHAALSPEAFIAGQATGREMTLDEAVAYALTETDG